MTTDEYLTVEYSDHHFCDLHHTPPAQVSLTLFATEELTVTQMDKMTRTILKPNSITLASSELALNMFGASSELVRS